MRTDEERAAQRRLNAEAGKLPRSESKTVCPHCGREPGGVHAHDCPRSYVNATRRKKIAEVLAG
jgi:hypothetical protein